MKNCILLTLITLFFYNKSLSQHVLFGNTLISNVQFIQDQAIKSGANKVKKEYEDILGNPFIYPNYQPAILIDKSGIKYYVDYCRLNLYNNSVVYLTIDFNELTPTVDIVNLIFVKNKESLEVLRAFELVNIDNKKVWVEVFNDGRYRLLKWDNCYIVEGAYSPARLKNDPAKFKIRSNYLISYQNNIYLINSLNLKGINKIMDISTLDKIWLKENHNKLNTPIKLINYLQYLNQKLVN